jgi:hypothetical protein
MNLSELKKLYDGKSVTELEKDASDNHQLSTQSRKEFIQVMFYFQQTERFRQIEKFKKSDFASYLRDRWNMTMSQYHNERNIFLNFPAEAEKYGVGIISRIRRKCQLGVEGTRRVLDEIKKEEDKAQKPLSAEKIEKTIQRFTVKKRRRVGPAPTTAKQSSKPLCQKCVELEIKLREANKIILEQEGQITKLKTALLRCKDDASVTQDIIGLVRPLIIKENSTAQSAKA